MNLFNYESVFEPLWHVMKMDWTEFLWTSLRSKWVWTLTNLAFIWTSRCSVNWLSKMNAYNQHLKIYCVNQLLTVPKFLWNNHLWSSVIVIFEEPNGMKFGLNLRKFIKYWNKISKLEQSSCFCSTQLWTLEFSTDVNVCV